MGEKPQPAHQQSQFGKDDREADWTFRDARVVQQKFETLGAFDERLLGRTRRIPRQTKEIDFVTSLRQRADFLTHTRVLVDVIVYENRNTHV